MQTRKSNATIVFNILAMFSIISGGCGPKPASSSDISRREAKYPTQEVRDMADEFVLEGLKRDVTVDMYGLEVVFVPEIPCPECKGGSAILGNCLMGLKFVNLSEEMWKERNEWANKATFFHELGHCVLGRGHYVGNDRSLMTAYIPATYTFKIYYEDYLDELFHPSLGLYEDVFDDEDEEIE